jgi:hypothetical protein
MEPENDRHLRKLLKEWKVGDAPAHLDRRVLGEPKLGWRFWLQGSIRIPVPVGLAAVGLLVVLTALLLRDRGDAAPAGFNLANFQPVATVQIEIVGGGRAQ